MEEEWRDVPGWEGVYQVSCFGRLKSLSRVKYRRDRPVHVPETVSLGCINPLGYYRAQLQANGRQEWALVHRLVALAFLDNPNGFPVVNHKDGNKGNNRCNNLEWCTQGDNNRHAFRTGLTVAARGEQSGSARLTELDVVWIRGVYKRKILRISEIGSFLRLPPSTVENVTARRGWKHVP